MPPDPRTCSLHASSSSALIFPGPENVFVEVVGSVGVGVVVVSSLEAQGLSEARLLLLLLFRFGSGET